MSNRLSFSPAIKSSSKLRLALLGPTGAGKTFTALSLTAGRRVAVIDSEHGSASKYADRFAFDVLNLPDHDPRTYIAAIKAAEDAGFDVVIVDSMTHAWKATQELVDQETTRSKSGNSFQAWGKVTPLWQDLIQAIVTSKIHVVATMRSKIEWVIEENDRGKKTPKKIGTKPDNRDGSEYEFDVVVELDQDHNAWTSKTRCPDLDGQTWKCPSAADLGATLFGWLEGGALAPAPVARPAVPAPAAAPPAAAPPVLGDGKPLGPPAATRQAKAWTAEQKTEAAELSRQLVDAGKGAIATEIRNSAKGRDPVDVLNDLAAALESKP